MNGDRKKIDELAMKDHKLILEKIESAFEVWQQQQKILLEK